MKTGVEDVRPKVRIIDRHTAVRELASAWWGGKNANQPFNPEIKFLTNDDGSGYVIAAIQLDWVRPNEAGDRYDGTVDRDRALRYARQSINMPVHLLFGARMERFGRTHANVMDGGHRVSAARLRGDATIKAIMQRSHLERLIRARQT